MLKKYHSWFTHSLKKVAVIVSLCSLIFAAIVMPTESALASSTGGYTALSPGGAETTADVAALNAIPASVRTNYAGFWNSARLGPDPYANYTAPKAPWQFCYSSAYQGNSWRVEGLTVAQNIITQLKAKGLVKGSLIVADANNSASLQATQIDNMVQQGCNVILAMQPPSVGLCSAFNTALQHHVIVVAMETGTACTDVIQSDFGEYNAGATSAKWLVQRTGGKGTVVMCDGIPGVAAAEARQAGALKVFTTAGMKVVQITGQWTPSIDKSQMLEYLSTHSGSPAGVWDGGTCAVSAVQALQQDGKSVKNVTGFEGACSWLSEWKQTGQSSIGFTQSGGQVTVEGMKIALRMLSGQKPIVNTLLYPLQEITSANFSKYYKKGMTLTSTCNAEPTGNQSVPGSYYNPLFTGGHAAPQFNANLDSLPIN